MLRLYKSIFIPIFILCLFTFNAQAQLSVSIDAKSTFFCPGGSTIITSQVNGNSGAVTYVWQVPEEFKGATFNPSIEANVPGTYSLVVGDEKNLAISESVFISQFDFSVSISPPGGTFCKSGDKLILVADTKVEKAEFRWEVPPGYAGINVGSMIDANVPGSYRVIATLDDCSVQSAIVTVQQLELEVKLQKEDPSSFGSNDGKIIVDLNDGVSPYEWMYSDAGNGANMGQSVASNFTIANLRPQAYELTVRDDRNCLASSSITLLAPSCEMLVADDFSDPICANTASGSITLLIDNGKGPYNIIWEGPVSNETISASNKYTIEDLPEGEYKITVKDSEGCERTISVTLKDPPPVNVSIVGDFVFCFGAGGTVLKTNPDNFATYLWTGGTTGPSLTVTTSGTYSVTVTDGKGCPATASVIVTRLPPLAININNSQSTSTESCAGACDGRIGVNIAGGSNSGRVFSWTGPGGYTNSTQNITNLCPGTYKLDVTDSEGCTQSFSRTISAGSSVALTLSSSPPSCSDTNDGQIEATFTGGSSPYDIGWSGPVSNTASGVSNPYTITGLSAGTYSVTVSDANKCTDVSTIVVNSTSPFIFQAKELSPACEGSNTGSIAVTNISNGVAPYMVFWQLSGGSSSSASTSSTSYTIDNLVAGSYDIQVVDNNGCVFKVNNVIVSEEAEISVGIIGDLVMCFEQSSGVLSTNPSVFIDYKWSTGANSPTITISDPGTYSVTVTDGGGCNGSTSVEVKRNSEIEIVTLSDESNLVVSCAGSCDGVITPKVSGGDAPYSYLWSGPGGFTSSNMTITDRCSGTYSLQVTDAHGCTSTYSQVISNSSDLILKMDSSPVSCPGEKDGKAFVAAEGGSPSYSYLWSNGGTTAEILGLTSGTYSVTVTDSKGCSEMGMVNVGAMTGVNGSVSPASAVICEGDEIKLTATGGDSYLWSTGSTDATITVSPTSTITYEVTITRAGTTCSDIKSVNVEVGEFGSASIFVSESSGILNDDGVICAGSFVTLNATGGVSYLWEGGLSNPLIVNPGADKTYTVLVTDANGCTMEMTQDIKVNGIPSPKIDLGSLPYTLGVSETIENTSVANCGTLENCQWRVDGVVVSNDCADLVYIFEESGSSTIDLLVENSCGCIEETSRVVDVFSESDCKLIFAIEDEGQAKCIGDEIILDLNFIPQSGCGLGSSEVKVFKAGSEVFTYDYTDGKISFTEAGNYTIQASYVDGCGCTSMSSREALILSSPMVSFEETSKINTCAGSFVEINFAGYDSGERVTVEFNGQNFIYESSSFDLFVPESGSYVLKLISVSVGTCIEEIEGEEIIIEVLEDLAVVDFQFTCNEATGTYQLTLFTSGGDPDANLVSSIPGSVVSGNTYLIFDLDPVQSYNITLSKGAFCASYQHIQPPVTCNCSTNQGRLPENLYYTGCSRDFYDIRGIYSGVDDLNPIFDTVLYVLHDGDTPGFLGKVYDMFPLSTEFITNDFPEYIPNKRYELSAVRTRKFEFFKLFSEGFSSFDFLGIENCIAVSRSIPVIWHGSQVNISGPSQVCENAYNEIFVSSGIGAGADLTINLDGLDSSNYNFVPSDGKLYVHFVSGVEDSIPIVIKSQTTHTDFLKGDTITTVCQSDIEYIVTIDKAHEAPDTSKVILWPGAIFASLDTTENICHRWGKTIRISSTEVMDTLFEGADDRFYFADLDEVNTLNNNRQIWVETYFCDDPTCFTRNIFNGQFPINVNEGVSLDEVSIYPNPTDGDLSIKMNNGYIGNINIQIFDIQGRQLKQEAVKKSGFVINKTLPLQDFTNGIYVLKMEFEGGTSLITKFVKQR